MEEPSNPGSSTPTLQTISLPPSLEPTFPPSCRAAIACTHCKAAKTKCIGMRPAEKDSKCKRCTHLALTCLPQTPKVRKRRKGNVKPDAESLGQKLDNIVSLLTTSQQAPPFQEHSTSSSSSPIHLHSCQNIGSIPPANAQIPDAYKALPLTSANGPSSHRIEQHLVQLHPFPHNDDDDINRSLTIFRTQMMDHFPFIALHPGINGSMLRQSKPFLLKTFVLVTSYQQKMSSQTELGEELLRHISEKLLIRGEKNLELLQVLLVYITWGNFQFHKNTQMTFLLQLAVTLVVELGLDKTPRKSQDTEKSLIQATAPAARKPSIHTLEERRAFLGCFYLSSIVFQCYKKKSTGLRHTAYLEQCCVEIDEADEYPTDRYLTQLVRLQAIVMRAGQALVNEESDRPWTSNAPLGMFVKASQRDLLAFRRSTVACFQSPSLFIHIHSAEITLLETGLYDTGGTNSDHLFRHLDQLFACLTALKEFFESWFQLPIPTYINLPFVAWAQLANAIISLSQLLLFEHVNWDLEHARSVIDFPKILENIAQRIEDAIRLPLGVNEENTLSWYARRIKWVKGWYEAKLIPSYETAQDGSTPSANQAPCGESISFDDMLWQEFMNGWSSNPQTI